MLVAQHRPPDGKAFVQQRLRLGVPSFQHEPEAEARDRCCDAGMLRPQQPAVHRERFPELRDRFLPLAPRVQHECDIAQHRGGLGVLRVEHLAVHRERVAVGLFRPDEVALELEHVADVVQAGGELRVRALEYLPLDGERLLQERLGLLEMALVEYGPREVVQRFREERSAFACASHRERFPQVRHGLVVVALLVIAEPEILEALGDIGIGTLVQRAPDGQRFDDERARSAGLAAPGEHVGQRRRGVRHVGGIVAGGRTRGRERLAKLGFGLVIAGIERQHAAEMQAAAGDFPVAVTEQLAAPVQRLADETQRRRIQPEPGVYRAHGVHQRCLDLRLAGELVLDAARAFVEDLPRGDGVAERFARIGDLEEIDHELRGLTGDLGFHLRLPALLFGLHAREPGGRGQRGRDRHAGQRRRGEHQHAPVLALLLALAQGVEADAQYAGDQLQARVAAAVLALARIGRDGLARAPGQPAFLIDLVEQGRRETLAIGPIRL